ncbi:MAG TPA: MFS transporter [Gryllotalpicola sp.]
MSESAAVPSVPRRFAALRNRNSRPYLFTSGLSMMADNIEHVISYWVLWQTFHSPALVGFQVVSHWLPFLLGSLWFGTLAERYDCRRLIQVAQGLFMLVSVLWGVLFLTHSLHVWQACVLLVMHGLAGSLWGPAEQLMLHDFVERHDLPSAVRLNSTFQSIGLLFGPAVGSAMLLVLGPIGGIFTNVLFYLPMTILMFRTTFTGHSRDVADLGEPARRVRFRDIGGVLRGIRSNHLIIGMIVLSGLTAITIGNALQVAMPDFADRLGASGPGGGGGEGAYGVLLFALGAGGVAGGFLLEATGFVRPTLRAAVLATVLFGAMTLVFAVTHSYAVAVGALVLAGAGEIASLSITASIVQLEAPPRERGRVLGVYGTFSQGLRTGGGLTLGGVGALLGVAPTVAVFSGVLTVGAFVAWWYASRRMPMPPALRPEG